VRSAAVAIVVEHLARLRRRSRDPVIGACVAVLGSVGRQPELASRATWKRKVALIAIAGARVRRRSRACRRRGLRIATDVGAAPRSEPRRPGVARVPLHRLTSSRS
jgi:hypothetical protein